MRPLLIVSTLCAVGLFGGAALAEHPDHAIKEKPTKEHIREHVAHERTVREAKTPERIERLRAHGEADHVGRVSGASTQLNRTSSDKAKAIIQKQLDSKAESARNCSGVGDECAAHRQLSSSTSTRSNGATSHSVGASSHPYSGFYAQQREKMRAEALIARVKAAGARKMGLEGK